jgi:hypothetical protein
MNDLLVLAGAGAALAAVLVNIGFWSPRRLWVKLAALGIAALFIPVSYAAMGELFGRPKPIDLEWTQNPPPDASVLAAEIREDVAIYLWLSLEGASEPRSYVLPWDEKLARELHEARREAQSQGTGLRMRRPFEHGLDESQPRFYAAPQSALPPKEAPVEQPLWHENSTAEVESNVD